MTLRRLTALLVPLVLPAPAEAQQAPLATVQGRTHDVVAQCLMYQMPPGLRAWPRVSPPPAEDAVVNVYFRGHDQAEDPVGVFYIRPAGGGALGISFTQTGGAPGEFDRIARLAAQRCAR
jgi:hypothetical protein